MAYDEELAHRLRELLAAREDVTEKRMFGGLAFLLRGHLTVAASRHGGILARVDPAEADALLAREHVEPMHANGRTMANWLHVAPEAIRTTRQLDSWVKRCVTFVGTLPEK